MDWKLSDTPTGGAELTVKVNQKVKSIRLWTADSDTRDFRKQQWSSRELEVEPGSNHATAKIDAPPKGHRAYLAELVLTSPTGEEYKLSTEARVTPDDVTLRPKTEP